MPYAKGIESRRDLLRPVAREQRARGMTFRQIAKNLRVSVGTAHAWARDVHVCLPNPWHRARAREAAMPPMNLAGWPPLWRGT